MKVLFACGGTGGHINPAIAVAKVLKEHRPECEILFAGAHGGMEARLVPAEGFELATVEIEGFSRKISPAALGHNLKAAKKAAASIRWAQRVIGDFGPDVAVGTGGYASFPILYAASKKGIPTAIHESNAYPGLTTRILAKRATKVLLNFDASRRYLKRQDNIVVTGNPIRDDMIYKDKKEARRELALDSRPLIVSFWGSLGAREMNKCIAEFIRMESRNDAYQHIHATGKFGYEWMPEYIQNLGVDLKAHPNIDLREYITDMPRVMAAADLVMCRGGASTLSEITALQKPAIIVPSPNVSANHQEKNARVLEQAGGAVVVLEKNCSADRLYQIARDLLSNEEKRKHMAQGMEKVAVLDATDRIYHEICALVRN